MPHGLLIRLKEQKPFASPAERNIIDYIQGDPRSVMSLSSRDLAEATFTSPSTIVRFCRKLGCSGYKEFQRELVFEFAASQERMDIALDDVDQDDDASAIIEKVTRSDMLSIEATSRLLDAATIDRCADLITSCRVVDLFGIGASLLVAHDFEQKLTRVDRECHVYDDWHSQWLCARNMHPDDLAIVISYSGITSEMVECARCARERGAQVIAITRLGNGNGVARYADYVLGIATSEPLVRSGAMGSRLSQLLVVDVLFSAFVAKNYERCAELICRNYTVKEGEGASRFAASCTKGGGHA